MTKEEKVSAKGRRFSVQRKMAVVARLLRGEPLELVARETNVTIQKLTEWRDRALARRAGMGPLPRPTRHRARFGHLQRRAGLRRGRICLEARAQLAAVR